MSASEVIQTQITTNTNVTEDDNSSKVSLIYKNIPQQNNKTQNDNININECIFILKCESKSNNGITKLFLSLELKSLPAEYGAIKINYSIKCKDICYTKAQDEYILTPSDPSVTLSDYYAVDPHKATIDDVIELDDIFSKTKLLKFDCYIAVIINYDLFGGIFSSMNEQIFVEPLPSNHKLVFGYLHTIYNFDKAKIMKAPLSLYELVYSYYLGFLNNKHCDEIKLVWRFNTKKDIALFWQCKHGDVLTSNQFEINGCVFYFELTPNGWGPKFKQGSCVNWMAVSTLPENIDKIKTTFQVRCDKIGYKQERVDWLTTPQRGEINYTPFSINIVGNGVPIKMDEFKNLKQFEFTYLIKINKYEYTISYNRGNNPIWPYM